MYKLSFVEEISVLLGELKSMMYVCAFWHREIELDKSSSFSHSNELFWNQTTLNKIVTTIEIVKDFKLSLCFPPDYDVAKLIPWDNVCAWKWAFMGSKFIRYNSGFKQ